MNIKLMFKPLKTVLLFAVLMFLLCGLAYPLAMTGLSQIFFPSQANGSLVYAGGEVVGSRLIGQDFTDPRFMKCRPSAVGYNVYTEQELADGNYGGVATGSNNFAPSNPALVERVSADLDDFLAQNPKVKRGDIPADLLTASGSGLDPHISPASAEIQLPVLAENTGLSQDVLREMVKANTSGKVLGVFGEETVNVLLVNLDIAKALGIISE